MSHVFTSQEDADEFDRLETEAAARIRYRLVLVGEDRTRTVICWSRYRARCEKYKAIGEAVMLPSVKASHRYVIEEYRANR